MNEEFNKRYKDARIVSLILIIGSLMFILSATLSEWLFVVSPLYLSFGGLLFSYGSIYFLLYWKCANYQKKNKKIPNWFRIISSMLLIFYLALYQLGDGIKKHRQYLLLKEIRFYILVWIFLIALISLLDFQLIKNNNFLWFEIGLGIISLLSILDVILMIFTWKYRGYNSKWLKILTVITLNYRNYKLYKEIIELNKNEKSN